MSQQLQLQCPACGELTAKSGEWLMSHDHFHCPCGVRVAIDKSDINKALNEGIESFRKAIERMNPRR